MSAVASLAVAFRAVSYLPPSALVGHVRRRLRNALVPRRAAAYRDGLQRLADSFDAFAPTAAGIAAAETVALFFAAKQAKNVESALEGRFTFLNKTIDFGGVAAIDWRVEADLGNHQLWRFNLAFMGYVTAVMERDAVAGLRFAAAIVPQVLAAARFEQAGDFSELWHAYAASQRLLAFTAALIRAPQSCRAMPEWAVAEEFMRLNAAYVLRNPEVELGYNHLERNLSALGLFGMALRSFPPEIERVIRANYGRIVEKSFCSDGVQKERSPMYQSLSVQSFRVLAALPFWTATERATIESRLAAIETALLALTLGDGEPAMFNDSWIGEVPPTALVLGERSLGFHAMQEGGYVRLARGRTIAIFDAAPIGPDDNPGHGHADFLSVEASVGRFRLLVDPGTYSYSRGAMRDELRSWQAHNGPAFAEATPVEFMDSFKVGRRVAAILTGAEVTSDGTQIARGKLALRSATIAREVRLRSEDRLEIEDRWEGDGSAATRFLIPAAWTLTKETAELVFRQGEHEVRLSWRNAEVELGRGLWSCRYNVQEEAHEIVLTPVPSSGKTTEEGGARTAHYVFAIR